jgi:hypothetical protein
VNFCSPVKALKLPAEILQGDVVQDFRRDIRIRERGKTVALE